MNIQGFEGSPINLTAYKSLSVSGNEGLCKMSMP